MHVSKSSTFYKFLDTNWFTTDNYVPGNLCPFMRRVLGSIIVNFLLFCAVTWFAVAALLAPLFLFLPRELWGEMWPMVIGMGSTVWVLAATFGVVYLLSRIRLGKRIGNTVSGMNSYQTTVGWVHAAHDKVCPQIDFK